MSDLPSNDRPRRAVALRYGREAEGAPRVVAKGGGELAERIVAAAREAGVPVREDHDLVALLAACELGDEIPAELFTAVAEILVHLYRLNSELAPD
jgi:flagellar biosynthesis protein